MTLYHGSSVPHLTELKPFLSNHEKPFVYLTDDQTLALLYAHNPIARPGGFFPYWFDKSGQLHYDEFFSGQTSLIYEHHDGWVYSAETQDLPRLDKMPWVYLSNTPVPLRGAEHIPDLYRALLDAEKVGRIIIHRYEDIPPEQQERHRQVVRRSFADHGEDDYMRFMRTYMPELF